MSDDDVDERVDALEDALRDLEREFRRSRRTPPRGPFGLPRPPTPREAAAFARDDGIPTAIAVLEAQIRVLEATRSALRVVAGDGPADDPTSESRTRATAVGRTAVDRLDRALSDLSDAVEDGALPRNETARALLRDARDLTEELADEVDAARETAIPVEEERPGRGERGADELDASTREVEDELDELRREYGSDGENEADEDDRRGRDGTGRGRNPG